MSRAADAFPTPPVLPAPPVPATTRRIAILVNPMAGHADAGAIERLAEALRRAGAAVEVVTGRSVDHLTGAATRLGADTVAVAGGDGTINAVVGALIARPGPLPRLAVVPQGTANVLAHEYRLPKRADDIAAAILAGRTRPLHLGAATDATGQRRPFFLMVSVGLDAAVVHAVEARVKRRFKKLAFLVTALRHRSSSLPPALVRITEADGEVTRLRTALAVVCKAAHYGGPFVLTRETSIDRPGLRLVALKRSSARRLLAAALRLAFGRLEGSGNVVSRAVDRVRLSSLSSQQELPVQIDGEPWGQTPVEVEPLDIALELVVG